MIEYHRFMNNVKCKTSQRILFQKDEGIQKLLQFYGMLADGAIFRLPGKKVEKCRQWLADECERNPENAVPNNSAINAIHFL